MKLSSWCLTLTLLLCPCVMFTAPGQHRNPRRSGGSQRQSAPSRQLSATNLLDNLREALGTNAPQRVIQDLLSQINFRAMQRGSADARAASALLEEARNEHQATMLLNAGVSVWERDQAGQIPLHRVRNADVARVILGRVPNTATARDQESRTPLHTAIAHHATHMLRVLTQHAN